MYPVAPVVSEAQFSGAAVGSGPSSDGHGRPDVWLESELWKEKDGQDVGAQAEQFIVKLRNKAETLLRKMNRCASLATNTHLQQTEDRGTTRLVSDNEDELARDSA